MVPVSFGKEAWNIVRLQRTGLLPVPNLYFQPVSLSFLEPYAKWGGGLEQIEECLRYGVDLGRISGFVPGKGMDSGDTLPLGIAQMVLDEDIHPHRNCLVLVPARLPGDHHCGFVLAN